MKLAIFYIGGEYRVHDAGCADVKRDAKKDTPWYVDVETAHEANLDMWSDIASDSTEPGTPEHDALCDSYATAETTYLPCVTGLPER